MALSVFSLSEDLKCNADVGEIVYSTSFDDSSMDGFMPIGPPELIIDSNYACSGSSCLKTTSRNEGWNGPSLNVLSILEPSNTYEVTAQIYHDSEEQKTFMMTNKKNNSNGPSYNNMTRVDVKPHTWTEIKGNITPEAGLSELLVYFESTDSTVDIYIDDVSIRLVSEGNGETSTPSQPVITTEPITSIEHIPPENMPYYIFSTDFDNNDISGWTPVDISNLSLDTEHYMSGNASLKVSDRIQNWDGALYKFDKYISAESNYYVCGYVYHEHPSSQEMSIVMRSKNSNGTTSYNTVARVQIPPGKWTLLYGEITTESDFNSPSIYFESEFSESDFFIDSVYVYSDSLPEVSEEISENMPQKDEYVYDFESSLDGWNSRGDNRVLRTDEYSLSGKYSVYLTDRTSYWNGVSKNIDFIDTGVLNRYTAHVMYTGAEYEDKHIFDMNLQYDYNGSTYYEEIKSAVVQKGEWTKITGDYMIPEDAQNITVYIQSGKIDSDTDETLNDLMPFYVDDVSIVKTSLAQKRAIRKTIFIVVLSFLAFIALVILIRKIIRNRIQTNKALLSASLDAMTQALNRNTYEQKIDILEQNPDMCKNLYIAVCDVNFLKYVNDNYGHEMGDEAITRCGALLLRAIGKKGLVYRTGGDEFVCMASTPFEEQIKKEVEIEISKYNGYPFSVAVGFSHNEADGNMSISELITAADKAMYENKQMIKAQNSEFAIR